MQGYNPDDSSSDSAEDDGTVPLSRPTVPAVRVSPPHPMSQFSLPMGMAGASAEEIKDRKLSLGGNVFTINDVRERRFSAGFEHKRKKQPKFGVCFDIDGVLARGTVPIQAAVDGMRKLLDSNGQFRYPVAFVTNALNLNQDKANQLSSWFGVTISKDQVIQSPAPLEVFKHLHDKLCLVVGQGKMFEIAEELGFKKLCSVDDVAKARPLLDVVDHENRRKIDKEGITDLVHFPRVEAILLLGEPKRWESSLQIVTDLLVTDGQPDNPPMVQPVKHIPVIACNMDLRFMERSHMPRFGHGAFLVCLEALYKKITGSELQYTALVGKPSEITYRFAEHVLQKQAQKLGFKDPIKNMYLIGDNPESDIAGSNLYQRYIDRMKMRRRRISMVQQPLKGDPELPDSRNVPPGADFTPQTVTTIEGILVCTGVYQADDDPEGDGKIHHGHRDFPKIRDTNLPTFICDDADSAIEYILLKEGQFATVNE